VANSGGESKPRGLFKSPWFMFWIGWLVAGTIVGDLWLNTLAIKIILLIAILVLVLKGELRNTGVVSESPKSGPDKD